MKKHTIKNKTMRLMSLGLLISCTAISLRAAEESMAVAVEKSAAATQIAQNAATTQTVQNTARQTAQQATDSIKAVAAKNSTSLSEWVAKKYEEFKAWLTKPMNSTDTTTSSRRVLNTAEIRK